MSGLDPIGELLPEESGAGARKHTPPDEVPLSDAEELVLELVQVGVGLRKAQNLVSHYPAELIRRQLRWLPHRSPRRPASLLISSIENDFDKPAYADE